MSEAEEIPLWAFFGNSKDFIATALYFNPCVDEAFIGSLTGLWSRYTFLKMPVITEILPGNFFPWMKATCRP